LVIVAKEGSKDLVIRVLQQGGDPNIPNHDKLTPSEVATDDSIKKILKSYFQFIYYLLIHLHLYLNFND